MATAPTGLAALMAPPEPISKKNWKDYLMYGAVPQAGETRANTILHGAINLSGAPLRGITGPLSLLKDWLNAPTVAAPAEQTAAPGVDPNNLFDVPAAGSAGAAPGGVDMNALMSAIWGQETRNQPGLVGPDTPYGNAKGVGQVLDSTGEGIAKQHGIPWKPELMTDKSPAGLAYQQQISSLIMQDELTRTHGDVPAAIGNYFAGPNPALHGPKTATYVDEVLGRLGMVQPGVQTPFTQPPVSVADPNVLAGMIPDPKQIPHITMPDAPHQAAPPPVSPYEQLDVNALLAPLQAAMQPVAHAAPTKQELLTQILSGISHGMAGMDPEAGLGDVLLGAGTGYSDTKLQQGKDARALTEQQAEAQRQVATVLAQMGLSMNTENVQTRNTNLDRARTGELAGQAVQFGNDTNDFNAQLQGLLANAGIDEKNIGAQNATANNRAETRINATQAGVTASNAAQMGAANNSTGLATAMINANGGLAGGLMNPHLSSVFSSANLDPTTLKASKDPLDQNAYEAGTYMAQGNVPLALGNLATEMLANTDLTSLGDSVQKQVKSVLQKAGTGADNQQRAQQTAAGIISQYLNTLNNDPEHRVLLGQLIDELAKTGTNKTAMILAGRMKRGQAAGPAAAK